MRKSITVFLGLAGFLLAVDTRYWSQDTQADFEKGNLKNTALRSDGRLSLSPQLKELGDPSIPFLWSAVAAANGTIYAAGGPTGTRTAIYEIPRGGAVRKLAELDGGNVLAMTMDRAGTIYAATSPDGKIYKVSLTGAVEMFYDPKAKYIWSLAFMPNGDLLAATGEKGELHRIPPSGTGRVWARVEDDHLRSMAITTKGAVYVGTEPSGLVVKIDDAGAAFVVHQSAKREVTSLLAATDGTIYAAAIGNRGAGQQLVIPTLPAQVQVQTGAPSGNAPQGGGGTTQRIPVASTTPALPNPVPGGSEIVRIDADGAPMKFWSHGSDLVYALALDGQGRLIAGTGNKGNLYRIDGPAQSTLLRSLSPTQITSLQKDASGRLLATTGNIGKVYEIGPGLEATGSFESEVFDVGAFAQWGRVHSKTATNGGMVKFETRSGNLDRPTQMWSAWTALNDGRIASPAARFLQWRVVFTAGAGVQGDGPELQQVDVAYLPKNLAPRVDLVEPTPANYKFPAPATPVVSAAPGSLSLPPIGKNAPVTAVGGVSDSGNTPALTYAKGQIGARWLAVDENGDKLEFKAEIKGEGEQTWKPLREKIRERYLSFDSTAYADGKYQVRITASDAGENALNQGLSGVGVSPMFLIDNTPPKISDLSATPAGGRLTVRFKAADALSVVQKAEMSINGGEWTAIDPTIRLSDSKELEFVLLVDRPQPGELTIAVRVTDEFDNLAVDRVLVK